MKKFISVFLCIVLLITSVFVFAGCTKTEDLRYDIVMITDGGDIHDGGSNESAWNGITEYAEESGLKAAYYNPVVNESKDLFLSSEVVDKYVAIAVDKGAKFIVLPGKDFAVPTFEVAPSYPDVNFILLDSFPMSSDDTVTLVPNVMSVNFDALQSGFLAGYTAVINGHTKLGYFGSVNSIDSSKYGAGYVQGAAYAADTYGIPVTFDYADYDSPLLDYNYDFTISPVYKKVEDSNKDCFKVKVIDGLGSGTYKDGQNVTISCDPYNDDGLKFDHWEVESNTEGVKSKKVDLSSRKKPTINLIVGSCDVTLTPAYTKSDEKTGTVTVNNAQGEVYDIIVDAIDKDITVVAPPAEKGMTFDHWEATANEESVSDMKSSKTSIKIAGDMVLTPVYVVSNDPTFVVTVENGSGSGAYLPGDEVHLIANDPEEGYYFDHWENYDTYGYGTGISMENEFCHNTKFEMVDRYASIVERMYDEGVTVTFAGGNPKSDSIFTALNAFDFDLDVIGAGVKEKKAFTSVIKEYGAAVKACLSNFQGATNATADCSNNGIKMTFVADEKDTEKQEKFDAVYKAIGENQLAIQDVGPAADVRLVLSSKCLSLNYWIFTDAETE